MIGIKVSLNRNKIRFLIWLVLTIFVFLGLLHNAAGSVYYSALMQPSVAVTAPPVILQNGTAGTSTIYANSTSAKVSVVAPVAPPALIFESGFETGNFSEWTETDYAAGCSITIVTSPIHHGSYAARSYTDNPDEYAVARKDFGQLYNTLFGRVYAQFTALPAADGDVFRAIYILHVATAAPWYRCLAATGIKNVGGTSKWYLQYRNGTVFSELTADAPLPEANKWYSIEIKALRSGTAGEARLYIDGTEILSATGLDNDEWTDNSRFEVGLGGDPSNNPTTIYVDCVKVAEAYIGPEAHYNDFVDNNAYDEDSSPDKGTHSNFTAQQYGPDAINDTLTEEDTGSASSDNNLDSEIVTHGSTTGISGAQTRDDVTENMTEGSSVESLYVDGFTSVTEQWTEVGVSPWLNDLDTNYIYTKTDEYWHEEFTFANPSGSGTINSVYLYMELKINDTLRADSVEIYIHDGTSWSVKLADWNPTSTDYYWENVDISITLDTWIKITDAKLMVKYDRSGSPATADIYIRRAYLYVDYTAATYQLEIEHVINSITNYENYNLTVRAYRSAENFYLQLYNFTSSQWVNMSTVSALSLTWYNTTFAKTDFINGTNQARIRYYQGVDATQEILYVDYSGVYGWNVTNYELDLEVQWTSVDFDEPSEELCIYGGTMGAENITIDVWNGSGWENLFTNLSSGWNNVSVTSYLTASNFTIRFKGSVEIGDTTQNTWDIDATLLHVWTEAGTGSGDFNYVLNMTENHGSNWKVRLRAYDQSNIDRLKNCSIYIYNGSNSTQIVILNGAYNQTTGPWYDLNASDTEYIWMHVEVFGVGASYVYAYLEILVPSTSTYALYIITFEIT